MDFVEIVHGTGFLEIRLWRPQLAIPVEIVEVLTGTDDTKKITKMINVCHAILKMTDLHHFLFCKLCSLNA